MDEALEITDAAQYHAFGHPLRQRILFALGREPATISKLAVTLGSQKGSIAHHLKVLREAGLVQLGQSRQVRGGTEQDYVRAARKFEFTGPEVTAQSAHAMHAVADEMAAAPVEPFVLLRQVSLTPQQVQDLIVTLTETAGAIKNTRGGTHHKIVLGLYRAS